MLVVICPGCRRRLSAPAGAAGKTARCPACRAVFRRPDTWFARLLRPSRN